MPRCPHCRYSLVLLLRRSKYKCAKCSRLWSQKLIETREFTQWNQWQRQQDQQNLFLEIQQKKKLLEEWKAFRALRLLFKDEAKQRKQTVPIEGRRIRKLAQRKQWFTMNKERRRTWEKQWRDQHKVIVQHYTKLKSLRKKQVDLFTLHLLQDEDYMAYTKVLDEVLPTNLLAHLL